MNTKKLIIAFIAYTSTPVIAGPIGLINTGTDPSGALLPDGTIQPGWTITAVNPGNPPGGLTPPTPPSETFVVPAFPGFWMPNNPGDASKWISYSYPLYQTADTYRDFIYQLSFVATGHDDFSFRVSADNGTKVYLNQESDPNLLLDYSALDPYDTTPFGNWSPWIDVSDLLPDHNTFICDVANLDGQGGNPSGLRVEFQVHNVPETAQTSFLLGASVVGLLAFRRFRFGPPVH